MWCPSAGCVKRPELQHRCLQHFVAFLQHVTVVMDVKHLCEGGLLACLEYHHIVTELLPVSWLP